MLKSPVTPLYLGTPHLQIQSTLGQTTCWLNLGMWTKSYRGATAQTGGFPVNHIRWLTLFSALADLASGLVIVFFGCFVLFCFSAVSDPASIVFWKKEQFFFKSRLGASPFFWVVPGGRSDAPGFWHWNPSKLAHLVWGFRAKVEAKLVTSPPGNLEPWFQWSCLLPQQTAEARLLFFMAMVI